MTDGEWNMAEKSDGIWRGGSEDERDVLKDLADNPSGI